MWVEQTQMWSQVIWRQREHNNYCDDRLVNIYEREKIHNNVPVSPLCKCRTQHNYTSQSMHIYVVGLIDIFVGCALKED